MIEQLHKPISALTAQELTARSAELRAMAATATTAQVRDALLKLATRCEAVAASRAQPQPADS